MTTTIKLDQAGRVSLPKGLREELQLGPGDTFELQSHGDQITLLPIRPKALLKKERGVWVYQGEATAQSIPDLLDQQREKRIRELVG